MRNLLITGGCGFVGTNFLNYVLNNSNIQIHENFDNIIVIDNLSTGHLMSVHKEIIFHEVDICDNNAVDFIFDKYKPTMCLHLAGLVSIYDCNRDPIKCFTNNVNGSINVLENCKKYNTRIIAAETSAVYEGSKNPPYKETESNPITMYAISKATVANIIKTYHALYDLDYVLLRFFNIAGTLQD
jgi:UDP-glucose 4-epimerase